MPNSFKAKDKVVCTNIKVLTQYDSNEMLVLGEEYTVADVSGNYIVMLAGVKGRYSSLRFELIGRV